VKKIQVGKGEFHLNLIQWTGKKLLGKVFVSEIIIFVKDAIKYREI
jgi:hypothetical protein